VEQNLFRNILAVFTIGVSVGKFLDTAFPLKEAKHSAARQVTVIVKLAW
jgi:hypothetical protein